MPDQTPKTNKVSRSLGIALGVTETIYLLGLGLLAAGISLAYSIAWALIAVGIVLLFTAFKNADERGKGTK